MLALVLAVVLAVLGALILGEYEFSGAMPYAAGVLLGLVVGEVVAEVGGRRSIGIAAVTGTCVACGLLWAAWISSGKGLRPLPASVWPAMALGVLAAYLRTGPKARRRVRMPGRSG